MQKKHTTILNTLLRVQRFMDENARWLGALSTSKGRVILDGVVVALRDRSYGTAAGLAQQIALGRRMVKLLDSVITPLIENDQRLSAEWKKAKSFRRKTKFVVTAP